MAQNVDTQQRRRFGASAKSYSRHATNVIPDNIGFYATADGDLTFRSRQPAPGDDAVESVTIAGKAGQFFPIDIARFTSGDDIVVLFHYTYGLGYDTFTN